MTTSSRLLPLAALALSLGVLAPPAIAGGRTALAETPSADPAETTDRLIVRMRERLVSNPGLAVAQLGGRVGEKIKHRRVMADGHLVVDLPRSMARQEAAELARRLAGDATVAYAEPDLRMKPLRVPNDSLYAQQWHYHERAGGINLPAAWDITVGSAAITVAVLDTGVRPHADFAGRLVAGYDFIGDPAVANDGDGRDADASDPGDFGCNGSTSSWHGTHVAGTIGAATNNSSGVAGVNWASKIQPVRVLGRCGGYTSDIADGMRWAAGIAVPGVPANATPARVLNLSLGGTGLCSTTFQNAINDVTARNAVVVVAAGNSNIDAVSASPANCMGVITVAATTRSGSKASFSNHGAKVSIAAPGGGGGQGILSTLNSGGTTPGADNYAYYQGTSMAAPHVAGVVSLMLSAEPALTPAQVLSRLKSSARPFPTGTGADCTTTTCGAGIVDAAAALRSGTPTTPTTPSGRVNLALAANGAVATASSTYDARYPATAVNNGDRRGVGWNAGGAWNDATPNVWPDSMQIDFGASRTVAEIGVFTLQDAWDNPQEPTETMTFSKYGTTDFEVQYWTGTAWETVPGGSVTGNNRVWRRFSFAPVTTSRIRVNVVRTPDGWSRLVEIEAYETSDLPSAAPTPFNVALAANGGSATASSAYDARYPATAVNNGDRRGVGWNAGGAWNDATPNVWPDSVQVSFSATRAISEVGVFTLQDAWNNPQEPTETMTFSQYGATDFDVQYWNGTTWVTLPGGSVTGNNRVWRRFTVSPSIMTNAVRVVVRGSPDGWSRLVEIQAFGF